MFSRLLRLVNFLNFGNSCADKFLAVRIDYLRCCDLRVNFNFSTSNVFCHKKEVWKQKLEMAVLWNILVFCLTWNVATSQLVAYRVSENVNNAQVGQLSTDAYVIDLVASRGPLLFVVTEPDLDLPLALDEESGELRTSRAIDREDYCESQSTCYVTADVSLLLSTREPVDSLTVQILIDDQNDNAPLFDDVSFEMEISESAPVGSLRSLPVARDSDSPRFGVDVSAYELVTSSDTGRNVFLLDILDGSPQLLLNRQLDRETIDTFDLELVARDLGVPPLSSTLQLTVRVVDFNDHAPVFDTDNYSKVVPEDQDIDEELLRVHAADADVGANADIRYEFDENTRTAHSDVFSVDVTSGAIMLARALDFEEREAYTLYVVARDSGSAPLSATATVDVTVTDVNDNKPRVSSSFMISSHFSNYICRFKF